MASSVSTRPSTEVEFVNVTIYLNGTRAMHCISHPSLGVHLNLPPGLTFKKLHLSVRRDITAYSVKLQWQRLAWIAPPHRPSGNSSLTPASQHCGPFYLCQTSDSKTAESAPVYSSWWNWYTHEVELVLELDVCSWRLAFGPFCTSTTLHHNHFTA